MKYYKKPLVALVLLSLGVQSYADVLQTSVGANHSTPKVIDQTENSTTSDSLEINPYGKLSDINQEQKEAIGIDFEQNPFIYGSGYHDSESNLEYMGARYYSADTGRFMAQDSYDLINRYNYANANPIMYVDPDGHKSTDGTGAIIIGAALEIIGLLLLGSLVENPEAVVPALIETGNNAGVVEQVVDAGEVNITKLKKIGDLQATGRNATKLELFRDPKTEQKYVKKYFDSFYGDERLNTEINTINKYFKDPNFAFRQPEEKAYYMKFIEGDALRNDMELETAVDSMSEKGYVMLDPNFDNFVRNAKGIHPVDFGFVYHMDDEIDNMGKIFLGSKKGRAIRVYGCDDALATKSVVDSYPVDFRMKIQKAL